MMFRIMLVDDDIPFLNNMLEIPWESEGCVCVATATNGYDALQRVSQVMPHLIVCDINMPVMSGIDFLEKIKQSDPDIQVVLLTVLEEFEYAIKAVQNGAAGYVIKNPHYRDALLQAVRKALRYFEGNSEASAKGRMLNRYGRLINLGNEENKIVQNNLILPLLEGKQGCLLTLKLIPGFASTNELVNMLDTMINLRYEKWIAIVWNASLFELFCESIAFDSIVWVQNLLDNHKTDLLCNQSWQIAWTNDVSDEENYWQAHSSNACALDELFYDNKGIIVEGKTIQWGHIDNSDFRRWLSIISEAEKDKNSLSKVIFGQLKAEWEQRQIEPSVVKAFCREVLRTYLLRYSSTETFMNPNNEQFKDQDIGVLCKSFYDNLVSIISSSGGYSYIINQILGCMTRNLENPDFSLNDISREIGLSGGYLSEKLKKETGKTFQVILLEMRMNRAKELLEETHSLVYEVAEKCGYSSYRSFVNAFSRFYGYTPKQARR